MPRRPPRCAGFTLVELVMVLVLVATLAAVALPRMPDMATWRVRTYADTLQAELQDLHRLALQHRREVVVTVGATGVSAAYASGGSLRDWACPAGASPCIAEAGPRSIRFNADGAARTANSTGEAMDITISHGGSTRVLRVQHETGAVAPVP